MLSLDCREPGFDVHGRVEDVEGAGLGVQQEQVQLDIPGPPGIGPVHRVLPVIPSIRLRFLRALARFCRTAAGSALISLAISAGL